MMKKYALFICNLQTKTTPSLFYRDTVILNVNKLLHIKQFLPVFDACISSVFIPDKFGVMDGCIDKRNIDVHLINASKSMCDREVSGYLINNKITDVVLVGMETQKCIQYTAADLAAKGVNIHIPVDAIGNALSRAENKYNIQQLKANKHVYLGTTDAMICAHLFKHYSTSRTDCTRPQNPYTH